MLRIRKTLSLPVNNTSYKFKKISVLLHLWTLEHGLRADETEHYERQKRGYNVHVTLHPYQRKKIPVDAYRVIALVVEDLGNLMIERNMSFCLPRCTGNDRYVSRIVYFEPQIQQP